MCKGEGLLKTPSLKLLMINLKEVNKCCQSFYCVEVTLDVGNQ